MIGDALGAPTEGLSRGEIVERYGRITGFRRAAPDRPAGRGTDDTDQALLLARLLLDAGGTIDPRRLGEALLGWARARGAAGEGDLIGPSTRRALDALAAGVPARLTGRHGSTNGAAMRITPVGIAVPPAPLHRLVRAVVDADLVTHHTSVAHAGAAAVAAAVSAGVDGASFPAMVELAVAAAEQATEYGEPVPADVAGGIRLAVDDARPLDAVLDRVGTGVSTVESVPAAFAVAARWPDDPWQACLAAANAGGDTDTVAAIAGAVVGARTGLAAFPPAAVAEAQRANDVDLGPLAGGLLRLRAGSWQ